MDRIIILLLVMALIGCSQSQDIQLEAEVNVFLSSDRNKPIRLTQQDKAYVELNNWLQENKSGWYTTSGRYPGGVYVKSGDYGIQVTGTLVVMYSIIGSEVTAIYVQTIGKDELQSVRSLAE